MIRTRLLLLLFLLSATPGSGQPSIQVEDGAPGDRLTEALDLVDMGRADLGCRPKAYWSRFPLPNRIPHLLPSFQDLFSEPLQVYPFARVMAAAVEHYATAGYRTPASGGEARTDGLFKTTYFLGIEKRSVGPRGYAANTPEFQPHANPLVEAVEAAYAAAGRTLDTPTGGSEAIWPQRRRGLEEQVRALPAPLHLPLATLVYQVADAWKWRQTAVARVAAEDMVAVFENRSLHDTQLDGQEYFPAFDRVAAALDEQSLYYAGQKTVQAAENAARALKALVQDGTISGGELKNVRLDIPTPLGQVRVRGTGQDEHRAQGCAVVVDLGGDDRYAGPVGATSSLSVPVAVAIDLAGNDTYESTSWAVPAQGAAILGAGVLVDLEGDDRYEGAYLAQGAGVFGLGLLWDEAGRDRYRLQYGGQGAGHFGIGLLVDGGGRDEYYLWGDGQGFGGVGGGVGVLADVDGDDTYTAEPDARVAGRGDYHTGMRVPNSNAQGAGMGRRGDISDGHAWAGGMGALIDLAGNDEYVSGNWAAGVGYWFGTGILYDGAGDGKYRRVYFSLASGAHFCIGAVIDEDGNDRYLLADLEVGEAEEGQQMNAVGGAGLGFGWDFTMALLVDKGGNDRYEAQRISGAQAMIRSTAILADLAGDDEYVLPRGAGGGNGAWLNSYDAEVPPFEMEYGPYSHYGTNFALLLDAGGTDTYLEWREDGDHLVSDTWRNGATWLQPARADSTFGHRSHGVGMDVEGGTIAELEVFGPMGGGR